MGWRILFSFSFIIHLVDFATEECLIFVASLPLCYDRKLQPNPEIPETFSSSLMFSCYCSRDGSICKSLTGRLAPHKRNTFSRVGIRKSVLLLLEARFEVYEMEGKSDFSACEPT